MSELVWGAGAAVGAGAAWWAWRVRRIGQRSRSRLYEDVPVQAERQAVTLLPALRRHVWIAWAVGGGVMLALSVLLQLGIVFCVALGAVCGVLTYIVEEMLYERRLANLDVQLANSIDLMVAALNGGAGLAQAIDSASRESREPLKTELQELLGRMRYGESPGQVFGDFAKRIPLEAYRLFCFTMTVHSEVGGSLAPILSTVGRSIRDRIEIARRIRAQSTEARASVIGILGVIYFLGLLMWRTNPQAFERYVQHPVGQNFVAGALVLQALGMLWIAKIAKLKF